ncbi:MAG TPA: formyltetrahydrofolate deformylase [Solirubrobacteraceae bacterium]
MPARLLITCPDRPGVVAAVAGFLFERGANVVASDQHSTDPAGGTFFMRMEFTLPAGTDEDFERDFAGAVAERFDMEWRFWPAGRRKRVAILVSREEHCLLDLLWRHRRGELDVDIPMVISNHPDAAEDVAAFGVEYVEVPTPKGGKAAAEAAMLERLAGQADLVVLARYMQVLTADFLARVGAPVLNIHHSFLPAFAGADPYARALERGVKIIGATAHYATEELDAGPIVEQDVVRVTHRQDVAALARLGADIERVVLARAVRWHVEDRVLVHEGRTVVFG